MALLVVLAGCGTDIEPPPRPFDAGFPPRFFPDAFFDPHDAFDFPDTGPPGPSVLPRQSWTVRASIGDDVATLTIVLDARAETGVVRGVAGANGRAASVDFDSPGNGALYARAPVPIGPSNADCRGRTFWIDQLVLHFVDADGDRIRGTLQSVTSEGGIGVSAYPDGIEVQMGALTGFDAVAADTQPPVLTLPHRAILGGYETLLLSASEPLEPTFMPRLTGPVDVAFAHDAGGIVSALWSLDTRRLPPGHYELDFGTGTDFAGHPLVMIPATGLDVLPRSLPSIDDLGSGITAIGATTPLVILGDDPGETALMGATSLFSTSRTIIAIDAPAGPSQLSLYARLYANDTSAVQGSVQVYDATGQVIASALFGGVALGSSRVPGFGLVTDPMQMQIALASGTATPLYAVVLPGGDLGLACDEVSDSRLGVELDAIRID
jgi:hypothetical protein